METAAIPTLAIIGFLVIGFGGLISIVGWIWMMVVAGKKEGFLWVVLIFFFTWLTGLIFCIMHKTGWFPWIVMFVGSMIAGIGGVIAGIAIASAQGQF